MDKNKIEMPDELTDEEMAKLEATSPAQDSMPDELTDEQMTQMEMAQNQDTASGIREIPGMALDALGGMARVYDERGGGASSRAGVMAILQGQNPFKAAYDQYGESGAPTGQQILEASPLKTPQFVKDTAAKQTYQPSFGGYGAIPQMNKGVGALVEMALDPAQAVPFIGGAKLAARGGINTLGMAAKTAAKATDIVTGTKIAGDVASATDKVINATAKRLGKMSNPTVRMDYQELQDVAKKYNIPTEELPDVFEFGKNSIITRGQRAKASTPAGEAELQKFTESRKNISNALDSVIHGAPTEGLPTASPAEIGFKVRDAHDALKKKVINDADFTYLSTANQLGTMPINSSAKGNLTKKIDEFRSTMQRKAEKGLTQADKAEANEIIEIMDNLQDSTNDVLSFAERIQELGNTAFEKRSIKNGAEFKRTSGILPQIYSEAKKAFIDTTRSKLGDEIADSLVQNNKNISDFLGKSKELRTILQNPNDEQVFRQLTSNTNNSKKLVELLPDLKKDVAATTIEQFIRRDSDGVIQNWNELRQQFGKKKIDVLKNLVDEKQAEAIGDIVNLGEELGPMPTNSPGAGTSGSWRNIIETTSDDILNEGVYSVLKNKARRSSGIQSLMDMAEKGTLNSSKGIKALSEASSEVQDAIRSKLPGFNVRKSILRETQSVKDSKKDKK